MHRTLGVNVRLEFILPGSDDPKRITNARVVEWADTFGLGPNVLDVRVRVSPLVPNFWRDGNDGGVAADCKSAPKG